MMMMMMCIYIYIYSYHHPSVRIFTWPSSSYICHLMGRGGVLRQANWRTFSFEVSWSWCLIWHCLNENKLLKLEHAPAAGACSGLCLIYRAFSFDVRWSWCLIWHCLNENKLLKLEHAPAAGACLLRFMFDLQNVFIWRKLKLVLDWSAIHCLLDWMKISCWSGWNLLWFMFKSK